MFRKDRTEVHMVKSTKFFIKTTKKEEHIPEKEAYFQNVRHVLVAMEKARNPRKAIILFF